MPLMLCHLDKTVITYMFVDKKAVICFGDHNKSCTMRQLFVISRKCMFQWMCAGAGTDRHLSLILFLLS